MGTEGSAAPQYHLLWLFITGLEFSEMLPLVKGAWDVSALFITTSYESFITSKEKLEFKKVKSFVQYSTKTEANIYSKHLAGNIKCFPYLISFIPNNYPIRQVI